MEDAVLSLFLKLYQYVCCIGNKLHINRYSVLSGFNLVLIFAFFAISPVSSEARSFATKAKFAILMDANSGSIMFEKNADELMSPASMAKLMTVEVVFDLLSRGELSLSDKFHISEDAWRRGGTSSGGSTMFAELNSSIPLEDLLRGVIIQSGNDACIAIAEGIAGNEETFAELMNSRAQEIGLKNSTFRTSTGLPHPEQRVTARDLAKLARHIIDTYPKMYQMFSEPDFTWNKIKQRNRNPLLIQDVGADGLKTGHTEESGYGLVGSALVNDQRLILVLNGMRSKGDRSTESRKLLDWGFRAFKSHIIFHENEVVGKAKVFNGTVGLVPLVAKGTVAILLPKSSRARVKAKIHYQGPLVAPFQAGEKVATLKIWVGGRLTQETPLYTDEEVKVGTMQQRAMDGLLELTLGWL